MTEVHRPHDDDPSTGGGSVPSADLATCRLPTKTDARGSLTVCEFGENTPFPPLRLYFLHDVPGDSNRGGHAHRRCDQMFVCIHGSALLSTDNGTEQMVFRLDDPTLGYVVPAGIWAGFSEFAPGTVMLALASEHYDEGDYIRDRADFADWIARRT